MHGMMRNLSVALLVLTALVASGEVRAEGEYVIGAEDVLSISVWERPELSRTVVVRADGNVTVPPVGDLPAAGKSTTELARELEAQFYRTLRIATQATVSVVAFNSRQVYVAGQVATPGRYSFEEIPGIIDLLSGAGGLNATADLANVRILRKRDSGTPETISVDVARAVQSVNPTALPPLLPGDVVYVPGGAGGAGQGGGGGGAYVLGEVAQPGVYSVMPGMDLLQLLAVAGGTTPGADLKRIDILGSDGTGASFRVRIDLRAEIQQGRGGPEIRPGDRIVISPSGTGAGGFAWTLSREALSVSRDVLNLFLIGDILGD